ncbi:MAG: DEAD/DEAH box helicase family protein [Pseudonocardia sp.]|nr:DEAD/DEAH box helicase family protein [Pseudonocardia sp.]
MRANLAALRTLRQVEVEERPATVDEQRVLARWSGWGAVPAVFDEARDEFAEARAELAQLLGERELAAAARNTLNAHYTDAGLVQAMWTGLRDLGFTGGAVLEPGCGTGNFVGFAPEGAQMTGVELDPTTAGIARLLYPDARIRNESFADTRAPEAMFDATIGNVPFGSFALADMRHNRSGHSIHNHFLVKSLHLTKPGGIVLALTSRYTMDAVNPAARREMAELADLLGAVRLPAGAHQRAAGTAALTDVLVLRRREPGRLPAGHGWERSRPLVVDDGVELPVNEYFHTHPGHVLGEFGVGRGAYRDNELTVIAAGDVDVAGRLTATLTGIAVAARGDGLGHAPITMAAAAEPAALVAADSLERDGTLAVADDGGFTRVENGVRVDYPVPTSQAGELRALLGLRDTVVQLLEAEAAAVDDTPQLDTLRTELNDRYDAYAARFGPLNRFSWRRTGRVDPRTGEDKYARIRPRQGGFRSDPFAATVYALEHFDGTRQTASKADIFTRRVIAPREPARGADSPADALAICLDTHGEARLDVIADLLGRDPVEARDLLGTLVFDDPGTDRIVPAAEYLSGNVRRKLADAAAAAEHDDRFRVNVDALTAALPADLEPGEITAQLGAAWIDADDVRAFLAEILEDDHVQVEHPGGSTWAVRSHSLGVQATEVWGTQRMPAASIAQCLLEQRSPTVYDTVHDGDRTYRVFNAVETTAAQAKGDALAARFAEWVWEDPDRAQRLARVYNDTFNSIVLRNYDDAELSLPGLALTFEPRPHQVAAVARMINEPAVGLYHEVGAGKTAEMAIGAMELRRLHLVSKPAIVVPNNMLEQFGREFAQLYPRAKLLIATKDDMTRDRRREFLGRCATGDWDAVIMTRGAFERIPMSKDAQQAYMDAELDRLREQITRSNEGDRLTVKRLEGALQRAEERMKAKLATTRDDGVTFEQSGIDYVVIDEAHGYKNLATASKIPGAAIDGSNRATDLDMKLSYLRRTRGGRCATFATATPIANSVTEAYVMQRYLRPDLLDERGISDFDVWAATFGQTVTAIELSPDGRRFRQNTRFAKFQNVPELLQLWHVSADIKTAEDLHLPTPDLAERPSDRKREPETVQVPPPPQLQAYIAELSRRADDVHNRQVDPEDDNMLKISSDGRAAALDLRLVGRSADGEPTKLDIAADRIADLYRQHRDDVFLGADGTAHPARGGLQIVFCDLGTPNPHRWNAYDELRDQLAARGVPGEQVRFIHEAATDEAKGRLFQACRAGEVAVLIGSTERMGVGTNVQARAVALHHLDCPWRPADLQQREGRILRQGNQNSEVQILRYVTEASFDGYSWQTVARKAQFIAQVMRGRLDVREIEDIGDNALSYNEVKALATGNPLLLEHAEATAELTRLERLERAHGRAQEALARAMTDHQERLVLLDRQVTRLEEAIAARRDTHGDRFSMRVGQQTYSTRVDAGSRLRDVLLPRLQSAGSGQEPVGQVGEVGGLPVTAVITRFGLGHADVRADLFVAGLSDTVVKVSLTSMTESKPTGMIASLEHRLGTLEELLADTRQTITDTRAEIARADGQRGKPFDHRDALITARRRVAELNEQMQEQASGDEDAAAASTRDAAAATAIDQAADPAAPLASPAALARQSAPVPIGDVLRAGPSTADPARPGLPHTAVQGTDRDHDR